MVLLYYNMDLLEEISLVNKICEGDCVFVGSACAYLNSVEYEYNVNDIDIVIRDRKTLNNLSLLGEIMDVKSNPIYGLDVERFYIKREGRCIDIFLQDEIEGYITCLINGETMKRLNIETQIEFLEEFIHRLRRLEKYKLMDKFINKLDKLCA